MNCFYSRIIKYLQIFVVPVIFPKIMFTSARKSIDCLINLYTEGSLNLNKIPRNARTSRRALDTFFLIKLSIRAAVTHYTKVIKRLSRKVVFHILLFISTGENHKITSLLLKSR